MWQVLYTIPVLGGIKIFGYGTMLFVAFIASINLAARRARREGLDPEVIYDLSAWVFVGGLIESGGSSMSSSTGVIGSTRLAISSGSGREGSSSTGALSGAQPDSSSTG